MYEWLNRDCGAYKCALWVATNALDHGIYPGPVYMNRMLHNHDSNNLNGVETAARTQALEEHGYVKGPGGKWVKS